MSFDSLCISINLSKLLSLLALSCSQYSRITLSVSAKTVVISPLIPLTAICVFFFSFFLKTNYLFLAAVGLHCCTRAFFSCSEPGLLFAAVRRLLIAVGFSSCGSRALERRLSSCGAQA